MNDNFKCIYHILKTLEKALDFNGIELDEISFERFEISKNRWTKYLEMMFDAGLIKGVSFKKYIDGETAVVNENIQITLKGLEYLSENSIMQRMYKEALKIANVIK